MNEQADAVQVHIDIEQRLGPGLAALFPEFTLKMVDDHTRLCGSLPDQAALHGVLGRIRDLGLTLIAVETHTGRDNAPHQPDEPDR
ncbi:MAG: hypothetical protein ACOCXR_03545 [Phototrophicaceae bacterium]